MNPAARILDVYNSLCKQQVSNDARIADAWQGVFAIPAADPSDDTVEHEVAICLIALRTEIDFAATRLSANGVPYELYQSCFKRYRSIAEPGRVRELWRDQRSSVTQADMQPVLAWTAWSLRGEDEIAMSDEALSKLLAAIKHLEDRLQEVGISPFVREFIQSQCTNIRNALRLYRVKGIRPLAEAVGKFYADNESQSRHIVKQTSAPSPAQESAVSEMLDVIKQTGDVCSAINSTYDFTTGAFALGQQIWLAIGAPTAS